MSIYTYQTMFLRKFYKIFIKFKIDLKCLWLNSPYVGLDVQRRTNLKALDHNVLTILNHNAPTSLIHAMKKKRRYMWWTSVVDIFALMWCRKILRFHQRNARVVCFLTRIWLFHDNLLFMVYTDLFAICFWLENMAIKRGNTNCLTPS